MYYYAYIDASTGVCQEVYEFESPIDDPYLIPIDSYDRSLVLKKKYVDGVWLDVTPIEAGSMQASQLGIGEVWLDDKIYALEDEIENHTHTGYASSDDLTLLEDVVDTKANVNHTHTEYAISDHNHDDYASVSHTHDYASTNHSHNEYAITSDLEAIETLVNNKANIVHTHTQDDVVGITEALNEKANVSHTHTQNDIEGLATALGEKADLNHIHSDYALTTDVEELTEVIGTKADAIHSHSDYATVSALNTLGDEVDGKANVNHSHDEDYADINHNHNSEYAGIGHDHDEDYATIDHAHIDYATTTALNELSTTVSGKANATHSHNDVYYTETEIDTKLSGKSDTSHTHTGVYDASGSAANALTSANAYTDSKIDTLVGEGASTTLDTIGEISSAIEDNQDAIDLLNSVIGNKANASDLTSHTNNTTIHVSQANKDSWNAAKTHADSAHAPSNAEVNQNAFSNIAVGDKTISADTKTDTLTLVAGNNISLSPSTENDSVTISATDTVYTHPNSAGNKHIPSGGSSGQILRWSADGTAAWGADNNTTYSAATQTASGLMSAEDKVKLDGIANNANKYTLPSASTSLGGVKSGGDVTIASGVITVNDDSHNHIISNIDGLQSALDGKSASTHNHDTAYDTLGSADEALEDAKAYTDSVASGKANTSHTHTIANVSGLQTALDGKANSSHGTHVSYSTTTPVMDGTATVGEASTVARSDHKHPTDTSRASKTEFDSHNSDTTKHITSTERTNWGTGYTHSQSAHAPSDAQKNQNAFSNVKVGTTTVAADTPTDTLTLIAGTNVTLTPDATGDSITISSKDTNTTYSAGTGISLSGTTFSNSGVRSIATGSTNGTISVNTNGTSANVAVKGLGSAAYTASTAYDSAGTAQTKADAALASAKSYADTKVANLINGAPTTLDTLKEIADAMAENDSVVDALETAVGIKANASDLTSHTSNKSNPHSVTLAQLGLTATAAELNKMDGVTATTAELNYVDGVTSNIQTQINNLNTKVDGKAASSHNHAASNITSGTLSSDRLPTVPVSKGGTGATTAAGALTNLGITATSSEINKLDGVTATTAEINILDGVTATTTELNYVDGVTSNIQTQLNGKASSGHTHNYAGSSSAGGNANAAVKLATARNIGNASFDGTANISAQSICGFATCTGSTSANANKYTKFARVTLEGAYSTCTGSFMFAPTEGNSVSGMLNYYLRNGSAITSTSINLYWQHLTNLNYEQSVVAVKISDGVFDLYYKTLNTWDTMKIININCNDPQRIALVSNTGWVDSVTAVSNSSINSNVSYAKSSNTATTATTATKLGTSAGSATQPVYFSDGKPVATTYTLGKSVPSDAKFTDTTYSAATTSAAGLMSAADKTKLNGIATGANAYTLPAAGSSLGGVKSGGDVTISSGTITVNDDSHNHVIANVDGLQAALDGKSATSHTHSYNNLTDIPTVFTAEAHRHEVDDIDLLGSLLDSKFPLNATKITETGTNLNDFEDAGIYVFSQSYTPTNIPAGTNGWLIVIPWEKESGTVKQIWMRHGTVDSNDFELYTRTKVGAYEVWGAWSKFYTTSNPPTAAEVGATPAFTNDIGGVEYSYGSGSGKNVLTEISNMKQGLHTIYSIAGTTGNPETTESYRYLVHKTSDTIGWIMAFGANGSIYSNYQSAASTFKGWKVIYDPIRKPLWTGSYYMTAGHTATPSKKLSECQHGWMLMWSDYDPDTGDVNNTDFCTTMIPNRNWTGSTWNGSTFYCDCPRYTAGTATDSESRIIKIVNVYDNKLVGNANNSAAPRNDVVLRAIYEF